MYFNPIGDREMIGVEKIKGHDIWAQCDKCGWWCASGVESIAVKGCKQGCTCRVKVNRTIKRRR